MSIRKTNMALKEVKTGEIHYFDYEVDLRDALAQVTEDGRPRFTKTGATGNKLMNPKGEEVFEKPETKAKKGRPPKTTSSAKVIEEPEAPEEDEVAENTEE